MNRATRDKFVIPTQDDLTSGNACLETPPAIFAKIADQYGPFDVDLTANESNHTCPVWLGPGSPYHEDALTAQWKDYGTRGYSNPPYGRFAAKVLRKAREEAKHGFSTTLLLPMRATHAFHKYILYGATELWFCDKRIAFWEHGAPKLDPKSQKPTGALFDSIIVWYAPGQRFSPPRVGSWAVPTHTAPMGWGK